jgi:hypothetical protein
MEPTSVLLKIGPYNCVKLSGIQNHKGSNEQSDLASLCVKMHISYVIVIGPGLTRVNVYVLDDPFKLGVANVKIQELFVQIPVDWSPHKRLE